MFTVKNTTLFLWAADRRFDTNKGHIAIEGSHSQLLNMYVEKCQIIWLYAV